MQTTGTTGRAGRVRVEQSPKRVRAYLGGEVVADTIHPRLVWEVPYYPAYYFPVEDVRTGLLVSTADRHPLPEPWRRPALHGQGWGPGRRGRGPALCRLADRPSCATSIRLEWDAMDGWFEEDEEVYTHPRDPYTRVDILAELPPRAGRGRRGGAGRVDQRPGAVRDRPAAPLVPPQDRPPHGPAGARPAGSPTAPTRARPSTGRSGSADHLSRIWPGPTARPCPRAEDRRAGRLLQRGGRPVRRQPAPAAAGDQVQQEGANNHAAADVHQGD